MKITHCMKSLALFAASLPLALTGKPNIVLIIADDLGWGDVGYHGSEIRTPVLDQLAADSTILERFYVSPCCSPTRYSTLTGRYPHRFGLMELEAGITTIVIPPWRDYGITSEEHSLAEVLGETGYRNRGMIGKWHLGHSHYKHHPLKNGFTHFYGHYNGAIDYFTQERMDERDWHDGFAPSADSEYVTIMAGEKAAEWIDEFKEDGPFYLQVAFLAPHTPLQALQEDLDSYGFSGPPDPDRPGFGDNPRQTFSAMVTALDREIGRIIDSLKANDLYEDTIIVFFSDNGGALRAGASNGKLRGGKLQAYEGGIRVPAIIRFPGGTPGSRSDQLMAHVDLLPTLLGFLGQSDFELRNPIDGIDLSAVLQGKRSIIDRSVFIGMKTLLTDEWKVVDNELFKIREDPTESNDVSAKYPDKLAAMQRKIVDYEKLRAPFQLPPRQVGSRGFVPPANWDIRKTMSSADSGE